jgi:glycine cleavage system H protein
MNIMATEAPQGLRYAKTHEWIALGTGPARVGLTAYAISEIKDIVYLDLPAAGKAVKAGETMGAIETVKAAFDLYAPVSGKVSAANPAVTGTPEAVSRDPYGSGWLVELVPGEGAAAEAGNLMDAPAYTEYCRTLAH